MSKGYYLGKKDGVVLDILTRLSEKAEGFSAEELATELGIKPVSARNYLELLFSRNFAEKQGNKYLIGQTAAVLWSRRRALLTTRKINTDKDLIVLGE